MELWIRSQDKEQLRKIVDLKYQKGTIDDDNIEVIVGTTQYDEWQVLGEYKTKERALEVLDEIQTKLLKSIYYKASEDYGKHSDCKNTLIEKYSSTYVYEMPED